jgi:hypothetical protein
MNNPSNIIKLWAKAKEVYEKGKNPKELGPTGEKQKTGIKRGLTNLRDQARKGLESPEKVDAFEQTRKQVLRSLRNYCRFLKGSKEEDKTRLPRFLKSVMQITVAVQKLPVDNIDNSDGGDPNLSDLAQFDTEALARELEKPETDEGEQERPEGGTDEGPSEKKPEPTPNKIALVKKLSSFAGDLKDVIPRKPPQLTEINRLIKVAQDQLDNSQLAEAARTIQTVDGLIKEARAWTPGGGGGGDTTESFGRLHKYASRIQAVTGSKPPTLPRMQILEKQARIHLNEGQLQLAAPMLEELDKLLTEAEAAGETKGKTPSPNQAKEKETVAKLIQAALAKHTPGTRDTLERLARAQVDLKDVPEVAKATLTKQLEEIHAHAAGALQALTQMEQKCNQAVAALK